MKSTKPKVLHEIMEEPMVGYVLRACARAGTRRVVGVVGYKRQLVERAFRNRIGDRRLDCVYQQTQAGTAHAVYAAADQLANGAEYTLVVSGDVPTMSSEVLERFVRDVDKLGYDAAIVTASVDDPDGYGRVVTGDSREIESIVEHRDATSRQRQIQTINAGIYLVKTKLLIEAVHRICSTEPENAQDEYYLTDLVEVLESPVSSWTVEDPSLVQGVNTRADLARATASIQHRINTHWMEQGITLVDPESIYIGPEVELETDVRIFPNVSVIGQTRVGSDTTVESGTLIRDATISEGALVRANSYIEQARVGSNSDVGPMCRLRPGADVGKSCRVGNFVEVKQAKLEDGVKAGHLAYLGNATIEKEANIGAGTITCNYDGVDKYETVIGEGAFTGSNSALVAPVQLGAGAYVGAGSVITEDVPEGQLGLARARQTNIDDWVPPSRRKSSDSEET